MPLTLDRQVCSMQYAKKLQELGVPQNSLFNWEWSGKEGDAGHLKYWPDHKNHAHEPFVYSAFTSAELGEMLPLKAGDFFHEIITGKEGGSKMWTCAVRNVVDGEWNPRFGSVSEADARARMLIYLLENKIIVL